MNPVGKHLMLAALFIGGCQEKPKAPLLPTKFTCTATVRRIEYHGDAQHSGDWYTIVLESPEGALWTIKVLYTYPPVWEGLSGEMQYEVNNRDRAEYKNLVVLRRDR